MATWVDIGFGFLAKSDWILTTSVDWAWIFGQLGRYWVWIFYQEVGLDLYLLGEDWFWVFGFVADKGFYSYI